MSSWVQFIGLDYLIFATISLAVVSGLHVWLRRRRRLKRFPVLLWGLAGIVIPLGAVLTRAEQGEVEDQVKSILDGMAPTYADELRLMGHAQISVDTPPDDPHYLRMIAAQVRWLKVNPAIADLYTLRRRPDGAFILLVDSETDYDGDGRISAAREERTAIGEVYDEELRGIEQAFAGHPVYDLTPNVDRWGEMISAYYPLRDDQGRVEAVLGLDIPAAKWRRILAWRRAGTIGHVAALEAMMIVFSCLVLLLRQEIAKRREAHARLVEYRRQLQQEVKERSAALVEAQRQAMQAEKLASLGQLAAGVAHEINTPIQYVGDNLRAISDFIHELMGLTEQYRALVQVVKSGAPSSDLVGRIEQAEKDSELDYIREDAPKAVAQGLEGVQRVAHIVRAMKDFSHLDRGQLATVEINAALARTLTLARNEYKYVADVETDFAGLPDVEAYAAELNQVFLNLIINAAHAIADTGKHGTITLRTRSLKDQVEVAIIDTGTGISAENRARVFDPFFTTKPVGKGTGQGLYIAHQIITKHGGTISFESQPGQGTTFIVRLPVHQPHEDAAGESAAPSASEDPPPNAAREPVEAELPH